MTKQPRASVVRWAADVLGTGENVVTASLHGDDTGPWLLRTEQDLLTSAAVLRTAGWVPAEHLATGAAALRAAEEHGVAAPRLIAADLDGRAAGVPATLETALPGSSASPSRVSPERLRAVGAAIAGVHDVQLQPRPHLPRRTRSGEFSDRPRQRRWAALYQASAADERSAVVDGLSELTGWSAQRARQAMTATRSTPLLQLADDRLKEFPVPRQASVFVHGDVWAGNMLWTDDDTVTFIDWKVAGVGDPGIDLGRLRMKMALQYGPEACAHVLAGWQSQAGRRPTNLAYWDAVAALHPRPTSPIGNPASTSTAISWTQPSGPSVAMRSCAPSSTSSNIPNRLVRRSWLAQRRIR